MHVLSRARSFTASHWAHETSVECLPASDNGIILLQVRFERWTTRLTPKPADKKKEKKETQGVNSDTAV